MSNLLLFFAIPLAIIIIASILETIINNPIAVAAFFFAIFLVVTFVVGDLTLLIFTIAYTILAYLSALITRIIIRCRCMCHNHCCNNNEDEEDENDICPEEDNNGCGCNTRRFRYSRYRRHF